VAQLEERLRLYEDNGASDPDDDTSEDEDPSRDLSRDLDPMAFAIVPPFQGLMNTDFVSPTLVPVGSSHLAPLIDCPPVPTDQGLYNFGTLGMIHCNCSTTAGLVSCGIGVGGVLKNFIDSEFAVASNPAPGSGGFNDDDDDRSENRQQRYRCYRTAAAQLSYRQRRPLPACFVGTVRALYPEPGGHYTGYRPA
jgi:hypothetical protein